MRARKPGKLPRDTVRAEYMLEYATDALEVHSDAVAAGAVPVSARAIVAALHAAGLRRRKRSRLAP